jgi:hypothetical protein
MAVDDGRRTSCCPRVARVNQTLSVTNGPVLGMEAVRPRSGGPCGTTSGPGRSIVVPITGRWMVSVPGPAADHARVSRGYCYLWTTAAVHSNRAGRFCGSAGMATLRSRLSIACAVSRAGV